MQYSDTFCGFLHKLYAATMDGKGREDTYNFFSTTGDSWEQGIGHRGQLPPPLPPCWRRPWATGKARWRRRCKYSDANKL